MEKRPKLVILQAKKPVNLQLLFTVHPNPVESGGPLLVPHHPKPSILWKTIPPISR